MASVVTMEEMTGAPRLREHDPWLGVEVRHLAALRAISEEGSFGAAALSLGYAQSAISQQVAALERHVGRRLFDRPGGSRPVTLTRAGELLLGHAESIMSRLSAARVDLESLDEEDCGRSLRIGASQSIAGLVLPRILQEIGAEPGEIEFDVRQSNDDRELLGLLEKGDLDVAFAELPITDPALETARLFDDPYVLLVQEGHPYAALDRALTLEEVAEVPLIALRRGSGLARLESIFAANGVRPKFSHLVDDTVTLHGYVVAGLGSALATQLASAPEGKPLIALPIEDRLPSQVMAIAWHRDRLRTCTAGLFVDLAVEVTAGIDTA